MNFKMAISLIMLTKLVLISACSSSYVPFSGRTDSASVDASQVRTDEGRSDAVGDQDDANGDEIQVKAESASQEHGKEGEEGAGHKDERSDPAAGSQFTVETNMLWPPNHKMRQLTVSSTTYEGMNRCKVDSIDSSEKDEETNEDGSTVDYQITGALTIELRSERFSQEGRTYQVHVVCTEDENKVYKETLKVEVPHDLGQDAPSATP